MTTRQQQLTSRYDTLNDTLLSNNSFDKYVLKELLYDITSLKRDIQDTKVELYITIGLSKHKVHLQHDIKEILYLEFLQDN